MKKLLLALFAPVVLALVGFIVFNAWFYPPLNLQHLGKDQPRQAFELAAKGFCDSSGLTFEGIDLYKTRTVETGSESYVWGTVACRTPEGGRRLAWIYLEWSTKRKLWTRGYLTVLADDDDEIYYAPAYPRQLDRALIALGKLLRENVRHVREARLPSVK